jgi:hypothetical protein
MGKGFAYAALGAAVGAAAWVLAILLTGLSLWVLAPIVGGAAGFGMMRGTQMRGGLPAGVNAAVLTLAAVAAARYAVVSARMQEFAAFDEEEVASAIAEEVAGEWIDEGHEVYDDEEGDFLPEVYAEAHERWASMSEPEQREYVAALEAGSGMSAQALTPIGLLFDFGIFGTICAFLAAGTAFKTGSVTLEQALVERGHAGDAEEAATLATGLRAEDAGIFGRLGPKA